MPTPEEIIAEMERWFWEDEEHSLVSGLIDHMREWFKGRS